jgi:4-cresol dehydrogenase (hydroxylating) flavoprotein subunit
MDFNYTQAIAAWTNKLATHKILGGEAAAAYMPNITEYNNRIVTTVLKPENKEDVALIVAIANEYKIPLFPFSTGKNWGQGSRLPIGETQVLVDLSAMNKIIAINENYRYAIIEAGVTQKQLSDALLARKSKYMLPVTGSGNDTSIVGNMLDRGVTVFSHRNRLLQGLEVVLGNGKTVKTGYWHYFENSTVEPFFFHAQGVGADLNGLFCQSNFGIVTAMVVQLIPRRKGSLLYAETKDKNLAKLFDTFRGLREDDILQDGMLITNKNDPRTTTQGRYAYTGDWLGFGSFNGSAGMLEEARKEISRQLGAFCKQIGFIDIAEAEENLEHPYFKMLKRMYHGIPSDYSLETMANIYGVSLRKDDYNVDNYKNMPGFSVVLPAVPFESEKILEIIDTVNHVSKKLGVQAFHNFASMGEMAFEGYYRMYFDRTDQAQISVAHQWNIEVSEALAAIGIFPYRLNNQHSSYFTDRENDTYFDTLASIKKVLDPNNIINPKKYNKL